MGRQMGKALGIIAREEAENAILHQDVRAWGAPGECHGLVEAGRIRRQRQARRHAKAVSGLNRRQFRHFWEANVQLAMRCADRIIDRESPFV